MVCHCPLPLAFTDPTDPDLQSIKDRLLRFIDDLGEVRISAALRFYREIPDQSHVFAVLDVPSLCAGLEVYV
jgi:hypothetical protein